jgi:hypothetical protein
MHARRAPMLTHTCACKHTPTQAHAHMPPYTDAHMHARPACTHRPTHRKTDTHVPEGEAGREAKGMTNWHLSMQAAIFGAAPKVVPAQQNGARQRSSNGVPATGGLGFAGRHSRSRSPSRSEVLHCETCPVLLPHRLCACQVSDALDLYPREWSFLLCYQSLEVPVQPYRTVQPYSSYLRAEISVIGASQLCTCNRLY